MTIPVNVTSDLPSVWPVGVGHFQTGRRVIVNCPHCPAQHVHPWPGEASEPGAATGPCGGSYYIRRPSGWATYPTGA
jgi:hypothetical protein